MVRNYYFLMSDTDSQYIDIEKYHQFRTESSRQSKCLVSTLFVFSASCDIPSLSAVINIQQGYIFSSWDPTGSTSQHKLNTASTETTT